jgi:hypothetical protein
VQSFGDRAFIYANGGPTTNGTYNKFVASGVFPQSTNVNLYYSFLYRFDTGTEVSPTGQMISAVNRENSGVTTTGSFHWFVHARNSGGNLQLGISKNGGAATNWTGSSTNWASANIAVGQTFFVVVRQQIITGQSNDVEDLWINPPANSFGTNEANIPPVSATTSDGAEDQSTTGPGRFWIFNGVNAEMDEIRIATNWADATPPVNQCISAGFAAQPTNITQVAEINAILSFDPIGTGASYQWQLSKDGGATWNNIPGAIATTYITPNLALATDNGNKYRAIVSVPCDNSSATSAVATVTLTAPVVTPDSTVMDDNFSDMIRDNTPITTNNSVWRTATSSTLDATSGAMVATTVSAKSTLYWGQFVDDATTRQPVHLDVGHQIKVTLPFTPDSFNAFTGNGALRFGLYDYADGGTFITTDDATATGSTGNGINVRGYMLSVDFGTNFSANSPLSLLVKNGMEDINLMGTTGDYLSMGSGPSGGGYSNAPAFHAGTQYTLVLTVTRTDVNNCTVGATITGGGTNWTWSAADTNGFAYHRFDVFAIRANSLETAADTFTIPEFKVEVLTSAVTPPARIPLIMSHSGGNLVLSWTNPTGFTYTLTASGSLTGTYTNVTTTSPYTAPTSGNQAFYRLVWSQ